MAQSDAIFDGVFNYSPASVDYETPGDLLTKPICETWKGLLRAGADARKPFLDSFDECEAFYSKATRFLWDDPFRTKHLGENAPIPKFQVTVNKAFEYVAVFGPMLYWQNPYRRVTNEGSLLDDFVEEFEQELAQDQMLQQLAQSQLDSDKQNRMRNRVWEKYLNKTPSEQPDGGLRGQSLLAINEALLSGRGLLVPRTYGPPNSDLTLSGLFFTSIRNLRIDPDSRTPNFTDAQWISLTHFEPYWDVERRFNLRKNSLRGKGSLGSINGEAGRIREHTRYSDAAKDIIVWHEIWSRCGIGGRFSGDSKIPLSDYYDQVIGDHVYLCISDCCNYPLNLPGYLLQPADGSEGLDEEAVKSLLAWPVPYWKDNRWPLAALDFYSNGNQPWPLAPLSVCIGELICLQILLSIYLDNAHANSKQIIGYLAEAAEKIESQLKSGANPLLIKLNGDTQKSIKDMIDFLSKPSANTDILQAMEMLMDMIEKKTGLSELLYGRNPAGTQERSAAAINVKAEKVNIRPEFMGNQVADWQSNAADLERICAYYQVSAQDVESLLGPLGAYLWDALILADDEEVALRGLKCRVEASDLRRPNKERDAENLQNLLQYLMPVLAQVGVAGNFEPFNGFLKQLGKAMEVDVTTFLIPPQDGTAQQVLQQLQQQQMQAEIQKTQAEAGKSGAEGQAALLEAQANAQATQMDASGQAALQGQELQNTQREADVDIAFKTAEGRLDLGLKGAGGQQKLQQSDDLHKQRLTQNQLRFWDGMQRRQAEAGMKKQGASGNGSAV